MFFHVFDFPSKMKNTVFVVALLIFSFGCQSTKYAQWLTPPQDGREQILGQAPVDDPFFQALQAEQAKIEPVGSSPALDPFAPVQQPPVASDWAKEETDTEAKKERIKTLATTPRPDAPDYLKPLNNWDGPFANRTRSKTLEQDIIRQVGHEQMNEPITFSEPEYDWEKEEPKRGFDWSVLAPTNVYSRVRDWLGLGPDETKANAFMEKGKEILRTNPDLKDKKKNLEAAKHFTSAGKKFPDSVLEEDALNFAGECYFFADDYSNAFTAYQKLIVKYQHSKHMDNAVRRVFKIGRYWEREAETKSMGNAMDKSLPSYDTFGHAKKAYETIFIHDPHGPVSDDALMALATAYLKRGRYQGDDNYNQAAYYYQQLREFHPSSKHIAMAHQNELYARTQAYLGPQHPSRTLEEARKLADISLWQFGNELDSEDKANLLEIKEEILASEAERLWEMGYKYFDLKKRDYGAARLHYNRLIAEYPQTVYAEKARKRLEKIEGLPDKPSIIRLPTNPFKN